MNNHNPKHSFSTAIILFIGFIIFFVITIISFIDYGVTAEIFLNLFLALSCLLCSYLMYKKSKQKKWINIFTIFFKLQELYVINS